MTEATDILRSYVRLVERLSGAASVSLYVPPAASGEREILLHEGRLPPVSELADEAAAARLQRRGAPEDAGGEGGAVRVESRDQGGVLYRIPLGWVLDRPEGDAGGTDRRSRRVARGRVELTAWIGLRFEGESAGAERMPDLAGATGMLGDEQWWKSFLGLAAAFAAHARTVSRTLFDQVTGLPQRSEFQSQLDIALAQTAERKLPAVLLLLGPENFGWVNERLDRRSGDLVLGEIAAQVRSSLRSRDHVSRYGGATFAVILFDTAADVGQKVAENLVRRLDQQRYHGGMLRLDFGAGLAVADGGEVLDSHEMIRRADQALSAARREDGGRVRIWEKGSDVESAGSIDRLQGIFTGDKSKDYRNMRLLLDSVAVVASSADAVELALRFTERLFDTLQARRVGVVEKTRAGALELLGGYERIADGAKRFDLTPKDVELLERSAEGTHFVAGDGGEGSDTSLYVLPLFLQDRWLGGIVLEVPAAFDDSDRRFLDALASGMAVALDRARLLERERARQQEEREKLEAEVSDLRRVVHGSRMAYRSAEMDALLASARKVARTDTTVLITGESGTGKEMIAHALHELSGRRERPLVVVDCGAIAPTLIESELFGHEKGAFTGAHTRKPGKLARADGGSVFLDEIGDLPLDLQSKLLRFVQEKQFTPVGGVDSRKVDVRIIAATHVDLRARVADGRFRDDLFHRLNVIRLHVPPLRDRKGDIVHLATMFLQQFAALYRRPAHHFTERARVALEAYPWPGNVRELQNLVMTSVLFCDGAEVDVEDLQGFQATLNGVHAVGGAPSSGAAPSGNDGLGDAAGDPLTRLRRELARELVAAISGGPAALVPLGKWLAEDLVLAADRLAGGGSRRAADLLGVPESTYRRQLRAANARRASGAAVRSSTWTRVAGLLEDLIRSRPEGSDACQWAEAALLGEIESAVTDARRAALLLGVTEPTLMRRRAELLRQS